MTRAAGRMDRRITIQSPTITQNELGAPVKGFVDLCTVWAEVSPVKANEQVIAGAVRSEIETIFRIEYRSDIESKMRVVYNGKDYNILSVIENGRHESMDLTAKAVI